MSAQSSAAVPEVVSFDQAQALYWSLIFQTMDYYEAFGCEPEES